MAAVAIPNLPAAIALTGMEEIEAVQAGTSVRVTLSQLVGLVGFFNVAAYAPTTQGLPTSPPIPLTGFAGMMLDIAADPPTFCVYVNGAWQYVGGALGV